MALNSGGGGEEDRGALLGRNVALTQINPVRTVVILPCVTTPDKAMRGGMKKGMRHMEILYLYASGSI